MLKLTEKEKAEYAKLLRGGLETSPVTEGEYFKIFDEVCTTEASVKARDGYDIPVWIVKPMDGEPEDYVFINIHGGGFVREHSKFDSAFCAYLVKRLRCTVVDVDYRLAPEYPYPTGLQDGYDVYKWVMAHARELGAGPDRIVIGGNSSGGQFSAAIPMMAAKAGDPIPALSVMMYPVCSINTVEAVSDDLDLSDVSNRGLLYNLLYCTRESDFDDPYVSLLKSNKEDLEKFPPLILATGGLDPLAPDSEEFAKQVAQASGSRVVVQRFKNSKHGFLNRCLGDEWAEGREFVFSEIEYMMSR